MRNANNIFFFLSSKMLVLARDVMFNDRFDKIQYIAIRYFHIVPDLFPKAIY